MSPPIVSRAANEEGRLANRPLQGRGLGPWADNRRLADGRMHLARWLAPAGCHGGAVVWIGEPVLLSVVVRDLRSPEWLSCGLARIL